MNMSFLPWIIEIEDLNLGTKIAHTPCGASNFFKLEIGLVIMEMCSKTCDMIITSNFPAFFDANASSKGLPSASKPFINANTSLDLVFNSTVSRFDKKNYFSKFKPKLLNYVLVKSLSLFLGVSDKMNRGMFVHSYFRKNK